MQEFVEYLPKEAERLNLLYDRTANPIGNIIDLYVSPHFGFFRILSELWPRVF